MQTLNDQLREKNTVLTKEAKEQKMEQEKKLAAANARLQQSKGNDPGAAKKAEELQRAMEAGEGYLLDEADMDVMTSAKHHGVRLKWHKRLAARCRKLSLADKMPGAEATCRHVEAHFGQGILVYFEFMRYLWMLNALCFGIGGGIVVYQVLMWVGSKGVATGWAHEPTQIPHFMLLSYLANTTGGADVVYTVLLSALGATLITTAVKKYSEEKANEKMEEVKEDKDANKFAKLAFGGWDFKMFDGSSVEAAKEQAAFNMHMALKEQDVLDAIANRSKQEKNKLRNLKIVGVTLNVILIIASWVRNLHLYCFAGRRT